MATDNPYAPELKPYPTPAERRETARQAEADRNAAELEDRIQAELRVVNQQFDEAAEIRAEAKAAKLRDRDYKLADQMQILADRSRESIRKHLDDSLALVDPQAAPKAVNASQRAAQYDALAEQLRSDARVVKVSEPAIYSRTSPYSWFRDLAEIASKGPSELEGSKAYDRIRRYGKALGWESSADTPEGRYIRRAFREKTRKADDLENRSREEFRSLTTGSSSAGAFVAPYYAVEDYAIYRVSTPTFMESACTSRPMPEYGLTINVPAFTGPAGTSVQSSENSGLTETDPTGTYRSAPVSTFAGVITSSQQLADRGGPLGMDAVLYAQLREEMEASIDVVAINAALAAITPATRASFTLPGLFSDIGRMSAGLEATAGTALPPTNLVTQPTLGEWLLAQVGTDNRPIFAAAPGAGSRSDGFLGYAPNGVGLWVDGNIPAVGSNGQLVLTNRTAQFLYRGEPLFQAFPEPNAYTLSVTFRCYSYACPVIRYPGGTASTTGNAYACPSVTWI